jgi:hypothetical protein
VHLIEVVYAFAKDPPPDLVGTKRSLPLLGTPLHKVVARKPAYRSLGH